MTLWKAMCGLGAAGLFACSASGGGNQGTSVATPQDNTPSAQGGAGGGSTGVPNPSTDPSFTDLGDLDPLAPDGEGCQQAEYSFTPKIPTVFLLVDRSNSMFDVVQSTGMSSWASLRLGALQVIQDLEAEVRFGFGAFSGQGGVCPDMPSVLPDLGNHQAIEELYMSLGQSAYKDTPTGLALEEAATRLWSDATEGEKYILFITDGEPDYCDDGNPMCPPDSVVARLQRLAAGLDDQGVQREPIRTIVFGLESPFVSILPGVLQAFANAGAGQPVAPLNPNPFDVYDQCAGVQPWFADFQATGKPAVRGQTIATYAEPGAPAGTATVFRPDVANQTALIDSIRQALQGVKSCTFDLASDGVKVDISRTDLGEVALVQVNGSAVPYDAANGWTMLTETTVQLAGEACSAWRIPTMETSIEFDFPCDVIVPIPR